MSCLFSLNTGFCMVYHSMFNTYTNIWIEEKVMKQFLKIWCAILFVFVSIIMFSFSVQAQENIYEKLEVIHDVDAHHNFTISFSAEIDWTTFKDEYITVFDENAQKVEDIEVALAPNKKAILVEAPKSGYSSKKTYTLFVEKSIQSKKGIALNKGTKIQFTIESSAIDKYVIIQKTSTNHSEIEQIVSRISNIPEVYLEKLVERGATIRLVNNPITDEPEFSYLKGVVPRGWDGTGKTWDDVPGIGGHLTIVKVGHSNLGEGHGTLNLELHEIAHAIDHGVFNNISASTEFKEILKKEVQSLISRHPNASNMYYFKIPEEYFAEAFTYYYLSGETRQQLLENAPLTYQFFKNLQQELK